jgi:hypothetical protein
MPAYAEDYPPPSPDLEVSTPTVRPGGSVTVTGVVGPFDHVSIEVEWSDGGSGGAAMRPAANYRGGISIAPAIETGGSAVITPVVVIGETTADSVGFFSIVLELSRVGTAMITATGSPSGLTAVTNVTVLAALPVSGGTDNSGTEMPVTGQRTGTLVALGAGVLVLGGLMVLAAVTRRRRTADAVGVSSD